MSSSFDAGHVYRKFRSGEIFTDQEITQGIKYFSDLEKSLRVLGPEFKFAADEAGRVCEGMMNFHRARTERPYK